MDEYLNSQEYRNRRIPDHDYLKECYHAIADIVDIMQSMRRSRQKMFHDKVQEYLRNDPSLLCVPEKHLECYNCALEYSLNTRR